MGAKLHHQERQKPSFSQWSCPVAASPALDHCPLWRHLLSTSTLAWRLQDPVPVNQGQEQESSLSPQVGGGRALCTKLDDLGPVTSLWEFTFSPVASRREAAVTAGGEFAALCCAAPDSDPRSLPSASGPVHVPALWAEPSLSHHHPSPSASLHPW